MAFPTIGAVFFGLAFPTPSALIDLAVEFETAGVQHLALTEYQHDVMTLAAALAQRTSRATISTAVANLYFRHPYGLAMAAAVVESLAGGRFTLGIGTGHPDENTAWLRLSMDRPVSETRDYLRTLRAALDSAGQPIQASTDRYTIDGGAIIWPPRRRVPILLGALGDRMATVGAEEADGVVLALATLDRIRQIRAIVGQNKTVGAIVFCCLRDQRAEARTILRGATTGYLRRPYYRRMLSDSGIAVGDAFDDAAIDALTIGGPATHARERLAAYREAGADLVLLAPPLRGEPDLAAAYRALAALSG